MDIFYLAWPHILIALCILIIYKYVCLNQSSHLYFRKNSFLLTSYWTFFFLSFFFTESQKNRSILPRLSLLILYLMSSFYASFSSVQFSLVAQSCPTLCDPMNRSTPGLPVHHQLPEFTQTHVHRVSDAIQPSHPLSSPSPSAPNPSQHQSLFQ